MPALYIPHDRHLRIGEALRPFRDEGVLVLGSGMSFLNLNLLSSSSQPSTQFHRWLDDALGGDARHRADWLREWAYAPAGRTSHPREEHLLPLMVASGARGDAPGVRLWNGSVGDTTVTAWAFP